MTEEQYSRVSRRMWRDEKFKQLSRPKPSARELWLYLLTGPHCIAVPGLIPVGVLGLAEDLDWSPKDARRFLQELEENGLVVVDHTAKLIWMPNAIHHNRPRNPSVVLGWGPGWKLLPECELRDRACAALREALDALDVRARAEDKPANLAVSFDVATGVKDLRSSGLRVGRPRTQPGTNEEHNVSHDVEHHEKQQDQDQDQDQDLSPRPPSGGSAIAGSSQVGLPGIGGQSSGPVGVRQAKPSTETTAVWAVLREGYKLAFDGLEYQAKPDAADNAAIKRLTQDVGVVEAIRLIRAIYATQWVAKRYSKAKYLGDAQKLRAELAMQAKRDANSSQSPDPPPKTIILAPPPFPGLKPTTGEATAPAFPQFKPRPERARVVRESGA